MALCCKLLQIFIKYGIIRQMKKRLHFRWEVFSLGDDPYANLQHQEIIEFLNSGNRLDCPTFSNLEMYAQFFLLLVCWNLQKFVHFLCRYNEIMLRCWNEELDDRPSFSELRDHFERIVLNFTNKNDA
jgi:hypothetical protein